LIALKGCCPNCGEEVYAFVRADESVQLRHKTECHVCEHPLVFQANVEVSSCCHNIYEGAVKDEQCH
jgi:ribosomal protein L31